MASTLLKPPLQPTMKPSTSISISKPFFRSSPHRLVLCSLPPTSREEAISQAKLSLSTTLKKPLNNPIPITKKLKKPSQPRYRVEIPIIDDSPGSLTQLAFEVFANLPISKKGSKPTTLILWPNLTLSKLAHQAGNQANNSVTNSDLDSVTTEILNSADLAVFIAPESTQVEDIKTVTNGLYPKPVVLFNPKWGFDEEKDFELGSFVGSFDVVFSFMGLEVRGVIKRRRGVVFKCVKDGVVSSGDEGWEVMVEEEEGEEKGKLKVVTRFKKRPSIGEVENVLYNVMAANSPVTKSVKFLRDLAANVTGKKGKQ